MSAYDRILAALKRLSPPWPSTEVDTSVGKELGSIATAMELAVDPLDDVFDEVMPDTTTNLIERWEAIARVGTRGGDSLAVRRERVLSVLRRTSGPRLEQLGVMLEGPLDLDINDIIFYEQTRELIEAALTETDATTYAITSTPTVIELGKPWPSTVDDFGVKLYLALDNPDDLTVTVTSPAGTVWTVPATSVNDAWYQTRTVFLGEPAAGKWRISVADVTPNNLTEVRLMVSNEVDSAQIYNFFAYRDPTLAGDEDIAEAQRLFRRTALAHLNSHVIQSVGFTVDDEYSLVDRDPVGV